MKFNVDMQIYLTPISLFLLPFLSMKKIHKNQRLYIYSNYILPFFGGLYATYHLLWEIRKPTIEELGVKKQHQRSHPMESALDHWTNPRLLRRRSRSGHGGSNRVNPPNKRGRIIAVFLMDFLRSSGTKNSGN